MVQTQQSVGDLENMFRRLTGELTNHAQHVDVDEVKVSVHNETIAYTTNAWIYQVQGHVGLDRWLQLLRPFGRWQN